MAGTLTATINIGTTADAALTGDGQLAATTIEKHARSAGLTSAGALDVASALARFSRAASLTGSGVFMPGTKQIYPATVNLSGIGALSASAAKYIPPVIVPDTGASGGARGSGSTTSLVASWSHTVAADANLAIVGVANRNGSGTTTLSATFGGVPMTPCGEAVISVPTSKVAIFKLKNPPTGTQTVTATSSLDVATATRMFQCWSHTYKNADADNVSAPATISGDGSSNPMTVTTPVPVPVGGYGFYVYARIPSISGSFTAFDGTQLYANTSASPYLFALFGHKQGAGAALSASATHNNMASCPYGAIGVGIPPLT